MGTVEEYTVFINRKTTNVNRLIDFERFFANKVDEVMYAKTIVENSAECHPTSQHSTISNSSVGIETGNASYVRKMQKSSYVMGIKSESEEGTIQEQPENTDAKITLDYKDRKICHSTSQCYGTSSFDEDGTKPFANKIECTIEDRRILFPTDGESSSGLLIAENLNILITPVPSLIQRKIVEELPEGEEDPYVKSIKTECEEDIDHVLPESTDADIIFGQDGENIECGTDHLEYDNECKIEETQILFGTEFAPAVQGSSEFANGKDLDVAASLSVQVINIERAEERTKVMCISPKFSDHERSESDNTEHYLECDTSTNEKRYKCSNCNMRFKLKRNLDRHQMIRHSKPKSRKCLDSEQSFVSSHDLNNHQIYVSDSSTKEKRHLSRHSISKRHKCPDCDKSFVGKYRLNEHQMYQHLKLKPYKCLDCDKSFGTKENRKVHQAGVHLKLKLFKCLDCDQSFFRKTSMDEHQIAQHLKLKPHKCHNCKKSFASKSNLTKHQRYQHLKLKPHKCPDCEKSFGTKENLKVHQAGVHLKLKPYKCHDCEKSFFTKFILSKHRIALHLKLKPHKCPDCKKSFVSKSYVKQHQESQHLKLKPFKCPDCEKSFFKKAYLDRHQAYKHLKLKPHKCPDCDWSFASKSDLKRHQMSQHLKLKPYKCPDCEKSFVAKSYLKRHQMSQHL